MPHIQPKQNSLAKQAKRVYLYAVQKISVQNSCWISIFKEPTRPTCRSCDGSDCRNNILEDIIKEKILTSGYFGFSKPSGTEILISNKSINQSIN